MGYHNLPYVMKITLAPPPCLMGKVFQSGARAIPLPLQSRQRRKQIWRHQHCWPMQTDELEEAPLNADLQPTAKADAVQPTEEGDNKDAVEADMQVTAPANAD